MRITISFILLTWTTSQVFSQITEHPLQTNIHLDIQESYQANTRSNNTLSIPFADDFSQGTGYPDQRYWVDNQAFINNTLALNPPSIGVATLDGLNAEGLPYGGGFGGSDTLTSRVIDLADEQSAYLSFYIQPKGLGYIPQVKDSLIVEGKTMTDSWERLESFEGLNTSFVNKDAPDFQRVSISLPAEFRQPVFPPPADGR